MILRDRLRINQAVAGGVDRLNRPVLDFANGSWFTVPAKMTWRSTAKPAGDGAFRTEDKLTAITRVFVHDASKQHIWWRGEQWEIDGSPVPVMVNGRVHHLEIPLKRVTG